MESYHDQRVNAQRRVSIKTLAPQHIQKWPALREVYGHCAAEFIWLLHYLTNPKAPGAWTQDKRRWASFTYRYAAEVLGYSEDTLCRVCSKLAHELGVIETRSNGQGQDFTVNYAKIAEMLRGYSLEKWPTWRELRAHYAEKPQLAVSRNDNDIEELTMTTPPLAVVPVVCNSWDLAQWADDHAAELTPEAAKALRDHPPLFVWPPGDDERFTAGELRAFAFLHALNYKAVGWCEKVDADYEAVQDRTPRGLALIAKHYHPGKGYAGKARPGATLTDEGLRHGLRECLKLWLLPVDARPETWSPPGIGCCLRMAYEYDQDTGHAARQVKQQQQEQRKAEAEAAALAQQRAEAERCQAALLAVFAEREGNHAS